MKTCCFYKLLNIQAPGYLFSLLSQPNNYYFNRSYSKIRQIFSRTENCISSFLPFTIRELNKLDPSICQAPSYVVFCLALLDFIRPTASSTFRINNVSGLELLTCLHVFVLASAFSENKNLNIIFKIR